MARRKDKAGDNLVTRQALYNAQKLKKDDGYNYPGSQNSHKGSGKRATGKRR